ncbi:pentapeptide repeat-containing protein [Trichocoleus sp. DQ-A3]|uniref:pentapeptide repeat-containing protein n=1 Tax=Cyanophyceae TaxID=3028117 RepID=UPI00168909A4|nr:pentapeptide repeat-containing protein [Coleofasciculus sp. FACHB-125]MBD1903477.1 pentapeptide repeat-containing protein [Coleofasciculus sp. FACHB-125]
MANEEHLNLFRQGVNIWNKWRTKNPEIKPDLRWLYFINANFSRANLSGANLSEANLDAVNFRKSNFNGAILKEANLSGVVFKESDLNKAISNGIKMEIFGFIDGNEPVMVDLKEIDLDGINLSEVDLSASYFMNANFKETNLSKANLTKTNLSQANLVEATLTEINFSRVNLSGFDLSGFNLTRANFSEANLRGANFSDANLNAADFSKSDLSNANFFQTILIEANFIEANLSKVELSKANLSRANLTKVNLSRANLSRANLDSANLSETLLIATQALNANFSNTILTGACIEDWNINSDTNFERVSCKYVYLRQEQQERRPSSAYFAPGEFKKLFQKVLETVDLIFRDGVNWAAFLASFQKLQVECGSDELFIQAFENKGDAFVIRVGVPLEADKAEIEKLLKRQYELETQLEAQKQLTQANYRHCADLKEIAMLLAGRTINVEATAVAESQSMSEAYQSKYDQRGANIGSNVDTARDNARVQSILNNYAPEQRQSLLDAAAEIQQLLQQLEQSYPTNTPLERQAVVTEAIRHIESNPTLKARVIGALKKAGTEGIKELVDHPLINIFLAAVEGWQEP